jgi:hypothetical protein
MLTKIARLRFVAFVLVLCAGATFSARAESPYVIYLAQLANQATTQATNQAQAACATVCQKRCTTDYNACSLNGKAPRIVINQTCAPKNTECTNNCNASCYK